MDHFPLKNETLIIIGICMEVYNILGYGFLKIVYKGAIEYEVRKDNCSTPVKEKT